jgi:hypothetical protein
MVEKYDGTVRLTSLTAVNIGSKVQSRETNALGCARHYSIWRLKLGQVHGRRSIARSAGDALFNTSYTRSVVNKE